MRSLLPCPVSKRGDCRAGCAFLAFRALDFFRYRFFEAIGRRMMQWHVIPDNVPETIIASRCYVTQAD